MFPFLCWGATLTLIRGQAPYYILGCFLQQQGRVVCFFFFAFFFTPRLHCEPFTSTQPVPRFIVWHWWITGCFFSVQQPQTMQIQSLCFIQSIQDTATESAFVRVVKPCPAFLVIRSPPKKYLGVYTNSQSTALSHFSHFPLFFLLALVFRVPV